MQVIRPAAFAHAEEEFEDYEQEPEVPQIPPDVAQAGVVALVNGVSTVTSTLYEHRYTFRNIALVAGGAYLLVKGPPILARSFAETAHFLREGWHGRGYEDRWLEEAKNNRS